MGHRVTSKGQITIPKRVRERMRIKPGDEIEFVDHDGGFLIRKQFDLEAFDAAVEEWSGVIDLGGKTVDEVIDEMRGE